ncbi:MAG TPA: DUF1007 family protein [Afifellaceae bacterium]|nr:DUF1007 family protein [Afifellaceae bacterium]
MLKKLLLSLALAALIAPPAAAHPHVWIDSASEILFDASGRITAIRHHWRFDEAFSAYAIQGLDTDGDGTYSKAELDPLAEVNVTSLSEFAFFTFMAIGEKDVAFSEPRDYWLDLADGFLTLHFTLPLTEPVKPDAAAVLEVYDPEYFVAFELPSTEAVRLVDAPAGCGLTVQLARELDADATAALAEIGPEQRELPDELKDLTDGLDNSATLNCG